MRASRVIVDLAAIRANVESLIAVAAPSRVMVVVKANGYGHGAVRVAEAALSAGAHGLCVALVQEGVELRRAGIEAPILVLSEQPRDQVGELVAHGLIATAYSVAFIDALADAAVGALSHRGVAPFGQGCKADWKACPHRKARQAA